jgi:heat-inducible transcriptional repressor
VVKDLTLSFSGTTQAVLDEISDALLRNLEGSTIEDINVKKISKLKYDLENYEEVIDYLVPILRDTLRNIDEVEYRVEGFDNILSVPEFSDGLKARRMYQLFENKSIFKDIFDQITTEGIDIKIGEENEVAELKECSLITTTYRYQARDFGKIAVLGPKRMDYRGIISTLEYVSNTLSDIFSGIYL